MAHWEVTMALGRMVTVEVEAPNEKTAREEALDRSRWLKSRGTRSRLKLIVVMKTMKVS